MNNPNPVRLLSNVITQRSIAANGYGILVAKADNFEIASNTIDPVNGRGMLFEAYGRDEATTNGWIHHNDIGAYERENLEYSSRQLEAPALRVRTLDGSRVRDLLFTDNRVVARTDAAGVDTAVGLRFSLDNLSGVMNDAGLFFAGNLFKADVTDDSPLRKAWAANSSGLHRGIYPELAGNTLESNDVSLKIGDYGGPNNCGLLLARNTISTSTDAPRRHWSVDLGEAGGEVKGIALLDTLYVNGAVEEFNFNRNPRAEIATHRVVVMVPVLRRDTLEPIVGAEVHLLSSNGYAATGRTNANGDALLYAMPWVHTLSGLTERNPFRVRAWVDDVLQERIGERIEGHCVLEAFLFE